MPWFDDTIAAFAAQLGLRTLAPAREGMLQLAFDSGELLTIKALADHEDPQALVFMEHLAGRPPGPAACSALERAHVIHGDPYPVQVAIRQTLQDWYLVALVRLPRRQFTADRLAHAVELLRRWLDEVLRRGDGHA